MAEYIEREAMIKRLEVTPILKYGIPTHVRDGVVDLVEKQPAADVVEVVHGRWEQYTDSDEFWGDLEFAKCSICGTCHYNESNYCPNCGARMDGE